MVKRDSNILFRCECPPQTCSHRPKAVFGASGQHVGAVVPRHSLVRRLDLLDTAVQLLRELEWSGRFKGMSTAMHLDNGTVYKNARCPVCEGINPRSGARHEVKCEFLGHRKGCRLARLLKEAAQ